MFWPCETRTSTCRSFATISSGLYCFLAIAVLLDVKDIPQVGPLQWGWIRCNQHEVRGRQLNYKSAEKYIGSDTLELLVLLPGGFAQEVHINRRALNRPTTLCTRLDDD